MLVCKVSNFISCRTYVELNAKRLQFKLPKTIHGKSPVSYLCNVYFFSELMKSRFHFVKVKFELHLNDKVYILTCIKVANKTSC